MGLNMSNKAIQNKAFVLSNGCPENRIDAARMQELLIKNNFTLCENFKEADFILFNSFGLTKDTQNISLKIIDDLQKNKKQSARFITCGCLSKIDLTSVRNLYNDKTFGSDDIEELGKLIDSATDPADTCANYLIDNTRKIVADPFDISKLKKYLNFQTFILKLTEPYFHYLEKKINVLNKDIYCIKTSTGCVNSCTYCAIKISRGHVKSKSISDIINEFKNGINNGHHEFALIGTDLGSYGIDIHTDLADLLQEIIKIPGDFKIKMRNVCPKHLIQMAPQLLEIFKSGKVSFFSSAMQSGSNRILKLMQRDYKIEHYKSIINTFKKEFPSIQIRTQVMVGFPGETDQDYNETVKTINEIDFDFFEVYQFQARPNTLAASMADQIPKDITRKRFFSLYLKTLLKSTKNFKLV